MNSEQQAPALGPLPPELQTRLNSIILNIPSFWEQRKYQHFTNHGPSHSERVHRLLAQLAQELPAEKRLSADEIYVVSAATWLYEIGMQKPSLKPPLDFEYHGQTLDNLQLREIRDKKHLLSEKLIYESVGIDYKGSPIQLGIHIADDYTQRIADICRYCSKDPLAAIPEEDYANGLPVRVRLLVALLRLADQLYIDPSRINLDLLEYARLPEEQFARWWAYHYTQILPISNAQIRFHYFLPSHQKEFLGHIRALIEPEFEFENNPTIQYLWDAYQLRLMPPRRPSISRFDQAPGFQRPMGPELITFLRKIKPIPTDIEAKTIEVLEEPKERCLLLLDYENFLLQLGLEGYFFNPEQISRYVVNLLREASQEHDGIIDSLAIGHWARPDLEEAGKMLKARVYDTLSLSPNEEASSKLTEIIEEQIVRTDKPKRIILIAPPIGLARTVRNLTNGGFLVSAWTSNVPDADIFHGGLGLRHKFLRYLLQLDEPSPFSSEELDIGQAACIMHFVEKKYLTMTEVRSRLEQVDVIQGHVDWWLSWLLRTGILLVSNHDSQNFYYLNTTLPLVIQTQEMSTIVIKVVYELDTDSQGAREDHLIRELRPKFPAQISEELLCSFLIVLKNEEILRRAVNLYGQDGANVWQLNTSHVFVVHVLADQFLPHFILSMDHALLKTGFYEFHEHTLEKNLTHYLGENLVQPVYQAALASKWNKRMETDEQLRSGKGKVALISPDEYHPEAGKIIRFRNLIAQFIKSRSGSDGVIRENLWNQMRDQVDAFTSDKKDLDLLLGIMLRDGILHEERDNQGVCRIKIEMDSLITQRLFGRMYLCNLVKNLRRLQATNSKNPKPLKELENLMLQHGTPNNPKHLSWVLEYAKVIRLLGVREQTINDQKQIVCWLQWNNFIRNLDNREKVVCNELPSFITILSRDRLGWVPRPIVFAAMSKNVTYGPSRPEIEYWVSQAVWRRVIEQERRDAQPGRDPYFLRAKPR